MILAVAKSNRIVKTFLPEEVNGDYIIKDHQGNLIGHVIAEGTNWHFFVNKGYRIVSNENNKNDIIVEDYSQFVIHNLSEDKFLMLYAYPTYQNVMSEYIVKKNRITIGSGNDDIVYSSQYLKPNHAYIYIDKNRWYIESSELGVYVNDRLIRKKRLGHGDIIFIYGLKIFCISDYIVVSNLDKKNNLKISSEVFEKIQIKPQEINEQSINIEGEFEVYEEKDYFLRSPRFRTSVNHVDIDIAPPPAKEKSTVRPTILTIGPQLTMMLTSVVTLYSTFTQVATGTMTFSSAIPSILLSVIMMISTLLWPLLTRRYEAKTRKKNELKRIKLYRRYLENKRKEISEIIQEQRQIIIENNVTLEDCQNIIYQKKRNLWERTIDDDDYLTVRVGTGYVKPDISINYEPEEFSMEDDFLKNELNDMIKKFDYVEETPLNVSLIKNQITAVVGNYGILQKFMESILLQIMTFHIYDELKIVIFTDENKVDDWNYMKYSPHCWDNQKTMRFIAANIDEKKKISSYLENIINEREEALEENDSKNNKDDNEYKKYKPYYLIIIDNINESRNLEAIKKILESKHNLGFSVLIKHDRIANLPSQCSTFINVTNEVSGIFKNELQEYNQQQFKADLNMTVNIEDCVQKLANIPVNIPKEKYELPKSIGFLEMYGLGNVGQFNSLERWKNNNPVVSLSVPVGIDQNGELFNMDIHEKAYGPHGLVAGTTGSGKSEWIITYILSLCVNFSPLEVQFVLIDYKGGGLAGSFENKETGISLPHLIGTITNLDKSEIRRSLASLEAESKRRQKMFNDAREKLNDSSMNIYKYQQYYRKGMLDEPLSHLFIISDEFAELKAQEPEFLSQLVSIARIGRSLGIHLILATQKPAGVVDEQMWSNSRFKVCLRVQDKQDSQDMIKCPDAAFLKQTGAFYFQVGLNEYFGLGQSAYAGNKYVPTSIIKKKIDNTVDVINRSGEIVNTLEQVSLETIDDKNIHGEELLNIIVYLSELSKSLELKPRKLWLDSIPADIYVDLLKQKYSFNRTPFVIKPIIGEYDDPFKQLQDIFTISLNDSNLFVGGISGSGKEKLLTSVIYSIITNYTPQEVGIYICDFGSETLSMFEEAPHVGEVVYGKDKVKIENLYRFAKKEISLRRRKYKDFGGNYESYIKYSSQKDRLIVIIINEITYLKENFPEIFEEYESLMLDCAKYGIVFVETSIEINTHKSKIFNSFQNKLLLKFNNSEYEGVFGNKARGINPKDLKGRGLFEKNGVVYEFQTASVCDDEKLQRSVKYICQKLKEAYKVYIPPIPSIPNAINMDVLDTQKININSICMGYSQQLVEPVYFDLQKNQGTLIISGKNRQLRNYFLVFNRQLEIVAKQGTKVYLFDPEDVFKMEIYKDLIYVKSDEIVNTIKNLLIYINNEKEKYENLDDKGAYKPEKRSLIVFYSASVIFRMCGTSITDMFGNAFDTARELELFDFVVADTLNDYKEIQRNKGLLHMFADGNGVTISNIHDNQMCIDIAVKDIRVKEGIADREGYIIERGKAKLSQMLQFEGDEIEEEDT